MLGTALRKDAAARRATGSSTRVAARERSAPVVALATAGLAVVLAVVVAVGRPAFGWSFVPGGAFGLEVDALSAVLLPVVTGVAFLVLVVAAAERIVPTARFHGLMLLFLAAVVVTLTATTLPGLLLGWEVMGAASWALIGFHWRDPERTSAGLTAFMTTRTADLGLYLAAGAAAAAAGAARSGGDVSLALVDLPGLPSPWRDVVAIGLVVAALGKAAQLPFSFWLSRAMLGPSPVSALLHSAAMVAMGGYLLLRVELLLAVTPWVASLTAWVGALTALALGVVAMAQRDLKQLLAASTAAQLGFVVLAAGVGDIAGGSEHLVGHAATKALLFLVAGLWLSALGTKDLHALAGVGRWWRPVGALFTFAALTLAGLPPLGLWVTKDHVLASAAERSTGLYVVGLAAAVLSAGYAAVAVRAVWRGPAQRPDGRAGWDSEEQGSRHVPTSAVPALAVLAVGALLPVALLVPEVADAVDALLGVGVTTAPGTGEIALSAGLSLVAFGLVLRRVPRAVPGAAGWWWLAPVARTLVVRPVEATARVADRLDRRLDTAVAATAEAAVAVAVAAGRFDLTALDAGVHRLARGVRSAGRTALRPQTGLVHQYLGAAVAVVTLGAVLLVMVRP
ncbi:MAG: NADH-quinone oxidoreductase subunit 5 family protein [Georgenia sp.]